MPCGPSHTCSVDSNTSEFVRIASLSLALHPRRTRTLQYRGKPLRCAPAGAQIRLLLRVLRLHVLDGEWDPTPVLSYLEQLRLLAADNSLPVFVDAATLTPSASVLMTVSTRFFSHLAILCSTAEHSWPLRMLETTRPCRPPCVVALEADHARSRWRQQR